MGSEEERLVPAVGVDVREKNAEDFGCGIQVVSARAHAFPADLIRLPFESPRVAADGCGGPEFAEHTDETAEISGRAGGDTDHGKEGRFGPLVLHPLVGMVMGDMGGFVAEDGRELGFVDHPGEKPGMNENHAVGKGKGVQGRVTDDLDPEEPGIESFGTEDS